MTAVTLPPPAATVLTDTDRALIDMLAAGHTQRRIATDLGLPMATVAERLTYLLATAAFDALTYRIAELHGDTPERIKARRADLLDDLDRCRATERRRDWDTAIRHAARELAGERGRAA